jgi:hypothetical protein
VPVVPAVETYDYTSGKRTSCWRMKHEAYRSGQQKLAVVQAVFNLSTSKLDLALATPQTESSIALHFFRKDASGTRYLETEFIEYPAFHKYSYDKGVLEFTRSYRWLDDLGTYQNLYVIAEQVSRSDFRRRSFVPSFDETAAASISLYSGKTGYPTKQAYTSED